MCMHDDDMKLCNMVIFHLRFIEACSHGLWHTSLILDIHVMVN